MRNTKNIIFSILLLAVAVNFAACGALKEDEEEAQATVAQTGSCTVVYTQNQLSLCMEYRNVYESAGTELEAGCVSDANQTVTWSTTGCTEDTALGYCNIGPIGGQPDNGTRRIYFYNNTDYCADGGIASGGEWIAN